MSKREFPEEKLQLDGELPGGFSIGMRLDGDTPFKGEVVITDSSSSSFHQRFLLEGVIRSAPGVWADEVVCVETRHEILLLSSKSTTLGQDMVIEDFADWILEKARFKWKKSGCDWESLKLTRR